MSSVWHSIVTKFPLQLTLHDECIYELNLKIFTYTLLFTQLITARWIQKDIEDVFMNVKTLLLDGVQLQCLPLDGGTFFARFH
jgi:hypothetical protein